MSDPKRLFHDDDDLGALLRAGKSEAPSDAHMDALAAKLGALGLFEGGGGFDGGGGAGGDGGGAAALKGGAASALKGGAASAGVAAAKTGLAVKVLSGVAIATALGGGAVIATRASTPAESPSAGLVATPVAPSSSSSAAPSVAALVLEDPLPPAGKAAKPLVRVAPSASSVSPESEVKMLERAQDALRSRPAEALAIADDHARRYPGGMLAQEREVIAIEALTRTGRSAEAKARAARFEQRFPGSAQRSRVRSLVGN